MIFKIFDWLSKKLPYTFAVAFPSTSWAAIIAVVFCGFLITQRADFEATGTGDIFLTAFSSGVAVIMLIITPIREGFFRLWGFKWGEMKTARTLNENIVDGHIIKDIPDGALLEVFYALRNINTQILKLAAKCVLGVGVWCLASEYIFSGGQWVNIPIILISWFITFFVVMIFSALLYELVTSSARRECKRMLLARRLQFQDVPLYSVKLKFQLFPVIIALILVTILALGTPLNMLLVLVSLVGFFVAYFLSQMIFQSIYRDLEEIKELAESLAEGEEIVSCFGSSDKELIGLSEVLDKSAKRLYSSRKELEEGYKEIEKRKAELEKFYKLTVGRELKMVELKKKIQELEN